MSAIGEPTKGRIVKVDGGVGVDLATAAADAAKEREDAGYTGVWTPRRATIRSCRCCSPPSTRPTIELGTRIAVAFARNPMLLANVGYDLQAFSKGRFILGLGSQIKPHITKRFSMPWCHPAPRMREMILAMRAIWDCWNNGDQARLPRRLLHAHADDAVLQPGPEPATARRRCSSPAWAS